MKKSLFDPFGSSALSASLAKMTDEEARRRIKVGTKCIELQQMLETQG